MNNITETELGETFIASDVNQVALGLALTREEALVVDAALIHAITDGVLDGYANKGIAIGVSDRLEALGYFTEDDAAELLLGVIDPSEAPDDGFPSEFYEDKDDPEDDEDDEALANLYTFLESLFYGEDDDLDDDPEDENGGYCDCEVCQGDPDEDGNGNPEADPNSPSLVDARLWDAYFGGRL